jgi:hypothetical protein
MRSRSARGPSPQHFRCGQPGMTHRRGLRRRWRLRGLTSGRFMCVSENAMGTWWLTRTDHYGEPRGDVYMY